MRTLGHLVEVIQGDQRRYFKYDSLGRMIRVRQPEQEVNASLAMADAYNESGEWTAGFTYDVMGNVLTATDAKNVTIANEYDKANRVTSRTYSDGITPAVHFYYDGKGLAAQQSPNFAKGKLTRVENGISATEYMTFDNFGRLTRSRQITDGVVYGDEAHPITYTYNLSGALVQETYPSGRVVKNDFESDGDVARIYGNATVSAPGRTYANSFSYTTDGRIESLRLGNGLWEKAVFNSRRQVTELNLGHGLDGDLWKLGYEYGELRADGTVDAVKNTGNIARQTVSFSGLPQPFVQSYRYDSLFRLTEATETQNGTQTWTQQFGYDRFGNRTSFSQNIGGIVINSTPTVDANTNRFNPGQGFSYDQNGNIVNDIDTASSLTRQFIFNGDNKQTEVKKDGVTIGRYFYDGEGKRVKKVTDTETTVFVYSAGKLIAEYSTQISQTPSISYLTNDHLGSPRVVTDELGQVKARRDFMPFGEELFVNVGARSAALKYGTNEDDVRQKFTGYERDTETDLDFAQARMYSNGLGRFTAVDPARMLKQRTPDPQLWNLYIYARNNPLILIDVTGEFPFKVYVRAFAPFDWFGPGSLWRGDNRGFSMGLDVSSRMVGVSEVETGSDGFYPMTFTRAVPSVSEMYGIGTTVSESYVDDAFGVYRPDGVYSGHASGLTYHLYGNNDAVTFTDTNPTFDIDIHSNFAFSTTSMANGDTALTISMNVTGDQFPAAESFIRDSSGNSVMLGVFAPSSTSGPATTLAGDKKLPMISGKVTVVVRNGTFTGVLENGKVVPLAEYNSRFTSGPAVKQEPRPVKQEEPQCLHPACRGE